MPSIRLSDDYFDNPKFTRLSDGAFRLWHESLAHCRRHSTDGLFDFRTMRGWRSFTKNREKELSSPHLEGANPLWVLIPAMGYKLHDYLAWNLSKEEEAANRTSTADRVRRHRLRNGVSNGVTSPVTSAFVPEMGTVTDLPREREFERKPDESELSERAGRLREELYPAWYAKHRHGARLRLVANSLEYQDAMSLVRTWDDARLEKLAAIVLTSDDEWISRTDRGFHIFAVKASWADDKLREWEKRQERRQA